MLLRCFFEFRDADFGIEPDGTGGMPVAVFAGTSVPDFEPWHLRRGWLGCKELRDLARRGGRLA